MRDRARALVVVDVGGGGQRDVVLHQHVLPRHLQRLKHRALDLARVLQGGVEAGGGVQGPVRSEHDPGGD